MKMTQPKPWYTTGFFMDDPVALKNLTRGNMVLRKGSLFATTPSACKRDKTGQPLEYPECYEIEPCGSLLPPNNCNDTITILLEGQEFIYACHNQDGFPYDFTQPALYNQPMAIGHNGQPPCHFQGFIMPISIQHLYYYRAGCVDPWGANAINVGIDVNFATGTVLLETWGHGNSFFAHIPGEAPYDLSRPIEMFNENLPPISEVVTWAKLTILAVEETPP